MTLSSEYRGSKIAFELIPFVCFKDFHMIDNTMLGFYAGAFPSDIFCVMCDWFLLISYMFSCLLLLMFNQDSTKFIVDVDLVLRFSTLHISV